MRLADVRTEPDFQQMIIDRARFLGWRVHHDRRDDLGIGGDPGFPDLVLARQGRVIFAELKTARGKVSQQQTEWIGALNGIAVGVYVWRPADWPIIQEMLK
jgi:VRR-NUC domain